MMTIQDLLDLSKTIAAPLFAGKTYPWEALADIGDFILQLGPTPVSYTHLTLPTKLEV